MVGAHVVLSGTIGLTLPHDPYSGTSHVAVEKETAHLTLPPSGALFVHSKGLT